MGSQIFPRVRWLLPAVAALFVALLALPVQAAFYVCRGDPIVELSDKTKLTIEVSLTVPGSQVRDVTFTVHAPPGVRINKITYLKGPLDGKELVVLVNDAVPGIYQVDTAVRLLLPSVAEYMTEVSNSKKGPGSGPGGQWPGLPGVGNTDSVAGLTNQILSAVVRK